MKAQAPSESGLMAMLAAELEPLVERLADRVAERLADRFDRHAESTRAAGPLTAEEAAELLRCHPRTVKKLIREGRLKAVRVTSGGSSRNLIARASVDALLQGAL